MNRGISQIDYNLLKLPKQISFSTGKVVSYTYTATGQKLRSHTSAGDTRDYTTYTRFLNSGFEQIPTPEGRVVPGDDDPARYEYFHRDHLGNLRAVYYDSLGTTQVGQWVDYDPWGLELSGLSRGANTNRLKFNGKESLSELGSGVLDYGARLYDASIGRWGVPDPLAEVSRRFSPFVYGNNNPVRMIDPDGREAQKYDRSERDDFGNVTFHGGVNLGEGGYVGGSTNGVGGPGKGKQAQPNTTNGNPNSSGTLTDQQYKDIQESSHETARVVLAVSKFLLGIEDQDPNGPTKAMMPMPFFMGGGAAKAENAAETVVNVLSKSEFLRIENAATRIGKPITVVGSRAAGVVKNDINTLKGTVADWDYVIPGLTSKNWSTIKNSLPGARSIIDNTPRNIDIFKQAVDKNLPHITINPRQ